MKCLVNYVLQNNDEIIKKNDIEATYDKNNLNFKYDDEEINITINNGNLVMSKENKTSQILFNFILNKKTQTKYYIKDLDFYIDTEVLTNILNTNEKNIHIEYELWLSKEYTGKFIYKIDIKEI